MFEVSRQNQHVSIAFSAELRNVDRVAESTTQFLSEENLQKHSFAVVLVLRELLNNAVIYGSGSNSSKTVRYRLELKEPHLVMAVADEGQGFDWQAAQAIEVELSSEQGRGQLILKSYCADVAYNEKGNAVTVKFEVN